MDAAYVSLPDVGLGWNVCPLVVGQLAIVLHPAVRRALVASIIAAARSCGLWRIGLPLISVMFGVMGPVIATESRKHLHFTVNLRGDYAAAASVGFNLADVSTELALNALPQGMQGVYWLGNGYNVTCAWRLNDQQITETVKAIKDNHKFSGIYYISDEPHPARCPDAPQRLTERTALIHSLDPRGKTFIVVLNSSTAPTEFAQLKNSADYIGVDPYPCNAKNELTGCNYTALRHRIEQALAAGIPSSRIVPVFQAFGQVCTRSSQNYYRLPTIAETEMMLAIWDEKVPVEHRPFDMAYSWGTQPTLACPTLQMADGRSYPDLRSVYKRYFDRMKSTPHR
jgi:hypothetical protein